jgi:hypothetical protein
MPGARRFARRPLVVAAVAFLCGSVLFGALQLGRPWLYDTDAAYHLAVAREIWRHGLPEQLPWARFTIFAEAFGDKEVAFHYLLAPFAGALDPLDGGRLALALLVGALFATLAWVAFGALGRVAALLPLALALLSIDWDWRLVRLRPELLALILFLAALRAAVARREVLLGLIGVLFALSYVAAQAFVGLALLWFLVEGLAARDWRPRLLVYPALGVAVGWLLHPNFPANLPVFWIQAVEFFRLRGGLDVGTEIRPETTDVLLLASLGLWLAALAVWRARVPGAPASAEDRSFFRLAATAALVFAVLFLLMSRFVLYAVPFLALALAGAIRARGERIGGRVRLAGGRDVSLGLALAVALTAAAPTLAGHALLFRERVEVGPESERRRDLEALSRALPEGATVAAPWGATDLYVLFAPQARYLAVLDPVYLALRAPAADELQRRVFAGIEPDVPTAVAIGLDSRFLAFPRAGAETALLARLRADPRVRIGGRGSHLLAEMLPDRNEGFVRDWRPLDGGGTPPVATGAAARFAAFVDLERDGCRRLVAEARLEARSLELAAIGPAELRLDGAEASVGATGAVLGSGLRVALPPGGAIRRIEVRSCPDPASGRNGFYLLMR